MQILRTTPLPQTQESFVVWVGTLHDLHASLHVFADLYPLHQHVQIIQMGILMNLIFKVLNTSA